MTDKEFKYLLETTMDSKGMGFIMEALAEISREKAEHLATNWQDSNGEKSWYWTARRIEQAMTLVSKRCPLW